MEHRYTSSFTHADAAPDEVFDRMRRADAIVRPWTDPAFRARVNPEVPEVVGPPVRMRNQRIRRGS